MGGAIPLWSQLQVGHCCSVKDVVLLFLFVVLILLCVCFVGRRVFGWGRCDYGQLGIPLVDATRFVSVPTEVKSLLGVKQVIMIHQECITTR